MKLLLPAAALTLLFVSCQSRPKVIEASDSTEVSNTPPAEQASAQLHKVTVREVLPTERYAYLRVDENGEEVWIAVPKQEVDTGATYYYRGGLKKENFKSTEYDRIFPTIYLVSGISRDPGMQGMGMGNPHTHVEEPVQGSKASVDPPPGGVSIEDIFAHPGTYEGKVVRVRGRVVKLNNHIMNRNWVHIQDASSEKSKRDLTITTNDEVMMGSVVAFEGKITLNKDFGAGYKYEIIMEEATLLQL